MKLTVIIISYNSSKTLIKCQKKLLQSGKYPITVIDNASTDGSAEKLRETFPDVEVIALDKNIGYGRAANIAFRNIQTPYAMLLNPDLFAGNDSVKQMMRHAEQVDPDVAILGPVVKRKQFTGGPPEAVEWVSGAAMLFDMQILEKVGFFDENIFLFSEDADLCCRTINSGYKIMLCHDVLMDHIRDQSLLPNLAVEYLKSWHYGWSRSYYFTKHRLNKGKKATWWRLLQYSVKSVTSRDKNKRRKYRAQAAGVNSFMKGEKAFCEDGTPNAMNNF